MSTIAIVHSGPTSDVLYVTISNQSGQVWNGTNFVTFNPANYSTYVLSLTNNGSNIWSRSHPSVPSDFYTYSFRIQQGGSPATSDSIIAVARALTGDNSVAAGVTPSARAWITLSEYKAFMKIGDNMNDALLQAVINFASEYMEKLLHRKIKKYVACDTFEGVRSMNYTLSNPVRNVLWARTGFRQDGEFQIGAVGSVKRILSYSAKTGVLNWVKLDNVPETVSSSSNGLSADQFSTAIGLATGGDLLFVPDTSNYPASFILSVKNQRMGLAAGYPPSIPSYITDEFVDYDLLSDSGGIVRPSSVRDNVFQVCYETGYDNIPWDLRMVMFELVAEMSNDLIGTDDIAEDPNDEAGIIPGTNNRTSESFQKIVSVDKIRTSSLADYSIGREADKVIGFSQSSAGATSSSGSGASASVNLMASGMRVIAKHQAVLLAYAFSPMVAK